MKDYKSLLFGLVCVAGLVWASPASGQDLVDPGSEDVEGDPGDPGIAAEYYAPQYYLNSPVFFDDGGQPFYYVGSSIRYVPRSYSNYFGLVRHYRVHRHDYRRWYRGRGHRYHGYRRGVRVGYSPLYHDGYAVFYDPSGEPYYYRDGRRFFIPRGHPRHSVYRSHYGRYRGPYRTWYKRDGLRFRGVRHGGPVVGRPGYRGDHRPGYGQPVRPQPGYGRPVRGGGAYPGRGGGGAYPGRGGSGAYPGRGGGAHPGRGGGGGGQVDCSRNPGHPACRRGGGSPNVQPPARGGRGGRGGQMGGQPGGQGGRSGGSPGDRHKGGGRTGGRRH